MRIQVEIMELPKEMALIVNLFWSLVLYNYNKIMGLGKI